MRTSSLHDTYADQCQPLSEDERAELGLDANGGLLTADWYARPRNAEAECAEASA